MTFLKDYWFMILSAVGAVGAFFGLTNKIDLVQYDLTELKADVKEMKQDIKNLSKDVHILVGILNKDALKSLEISSK